MLADTRHAAVSGWLGSPAAGGRAGGPVGACWRPIGLPGVHSRHCRTGPDVIYPRQRRRCRQDEVWALSHDRISCVNGPGGPGTGTGRAGTGARRHPSGVCGVIGSDWNHSGGGLNFFLQAKAGQALMSLTWLGQLEVGYRGIPGPVSGESQFHFVQPKQNLLLAAMYRGALHSIRGRREELSVFILEYQDPSLQGYPIPFSLVKTPDFPLVPPVDKTTETWKLGAMETWKHGSFNELTFFGPCDRERS